MPTYAQLEAESWWLAEFEAPAHASFNARMRRVYHLTPATAGSKGDNNHLSGRHRSRNWDLNSRFCTDRSYGTRDGRDRTGDGDWLRATDIGIAGPTHWAAAHRLDAAVRAGRLPCIAEWFGTFNGQQVTGWFEGGPGTSDDSHLSHLHVGLWTSYCNNAGQLQLLGDIITGEDDMTPAQAQQLDDVTWVIDAVNAASPEIRGGRWKGQPSTISVAIRDIEAKVGTLSQPQVDASAVAAALAGNQAFLAAIAKAVLDELHRRDAE